MGRCSHIIRLDRLPSAQQEEEGLHLLHAHAVGRRCLRVGDAVTDPRSHQPGADAVQRCLNGRELGDHVLAVRALVDQALDAAQLTFGAAQSLLDIVGDLIGEPPDRTS